MTACRSESLNAEDVRQPSSRVWRPEAGGLTPIRDEAATTPNPFTELERDATHAAFRGFIESGAYPCVGAKSALSLNAYRIGLYEPLGSREAIAHATQDLQWFAQAIETIDAHFATFVAVFRGQAAASESAFSRSFWRHLRGMIRRDGGHYAWDPAVSDDPQDPEYALSVGGRAMFVVGLHPAASRVARRFPLTALIFNAHSQFAALRAQGKYGTLRDAIRQRDRALQGSRNPMLADHGATSGAAQYDGVAHPDGWVAPLPRSGISECPMHHRTENE